jgi:hypothetical protein
MSNSLAINCRKLTRFPLFVGKPMGTEASMDRLRKLRPSGRKASDQAMDTTQLTISVLMYFVLPVWLAAGFADYLCHRASSIATTSGAKESILHLLQFAEMGVAVLAALFLEINALVLLIMLICFVCMRPLRCGT